MIKKIIVIISLTFLFLFVRPIHAESSETELVVIYEKSSYLAGERVDITLNLKNYNALVFIRLVFQFSQDELEILKINNRYFQYDFVDQLFLIMECNNAINVFNESTSTLYYIVYNIKNDSVGYTDDPTNYRNRLGTVSFTTKVDIEDIATFFSEETNIQLTLEDKEYNLIPNTTKYYERLKYQCEFNYTYDVGQEIDNIEELYEDVIILNREAVDVDIKLDFQLIDIQKIGEQQVIISIRDFKTKNLIIDLRPITFIDRFPPDINGPPKIVIESNNLLSTPLDKDIYISDNYCKRQDMTIKYTYYAPDNTIIPEDQILTYLQSHQQAFLKIEVTDTSNNKAIPFTREIEIIDKTPPVVTDIEELVLVNEEVDSFDLEKTLIISDSYDPNPMLIVSFYDLEGYQIDGYETQFQKGKGVYILYSGLDRDFNQTPVYELLVRVVDNIIPVVEVESNLYLEDDQINSFNPATLVSSYDNFTLENDPIITYYKTDQATLIMGLTSFKEYLFNGYVGYVKYEISDNAGNISDPVFQMVTPLDVTCPVISVLNIEQDQVYSSLDKIEYMVTDNFQNSVDVLITLNGFPYMGLPIKQKGMYQLLILARDQAGNESQFVIDFEIKNKQFISGEGAILDFINEFFEFIIGGFVVVIVSTYVCVFYIKKKKGQHLNI